MGRVQRCFHRNSLRYLRNFSQLAVGGGHSSSVSFQAEVWWTVWRRKQHLNHICDHFHPTSSTQNTEITSYLNMLPGWRLGANGSQWRKTCPHRSRRCDLVLPAGWCTSRDLPQTQRWMQAFKNNSCYEIAYESRTQDRSTENDKDYDKETKTAASNDVSALVCTYQGFSSSSSPSHPSIFQTRCRQSCQTVAAPPAGKWTLSIGKAAEHSHGTFLQRNKL